MKSYGTPGRGGSNHQPDPGLLRGVLASDTEPKVYPENRCRLCEQEGRDIDECFRLHWSGRAV